MDETFHFNNIDNTVWQIPTPPPSVDQTVATLVDLLANEIDTSTAMAEELLELEEEFGLIGGDLVETIKTLDKTRSEHGHQLDVIKGFVQTGDFLALAEYLQVDVPIPGGKRVQVGDFLETLRDYEDAPVGTVVAYSGSEATGYQRVVDGWIDLADEYPLSSAGLGETRRRVVEVPA